VFSVLGQQHLPIFLRERHRSCCQFSPKETLHSPTHCSTPPSLTLQTGAWLRPAPKPVTPHVMTPPRPLTLKEPPHTASILSFRIAVTSSRHRLVTAVAHNTGAAADAGGHCRVSWGCLAWGEGLTQACRHLVDGCGECGAEDCMAAAHYCGQLNSSRKC
jgi:hypothetical protein